MKYYHSESNSGFQCHCIRLVPCRRCGDDDKLYMIKLSTATKSWRDTGFYVYGVDCSNHCSAKKGTSHRVPHFPDIYTAERWWNIRQWKADRLPAQTHETYTKILLLKAARLRRAGFLVCIKNGSTYIEDRYEEMTRTKARNEWMRRQNEAEKGRETK